MLDPRSAADDVERIGRHRFHELEARARAFLVEVERELVRPKGTLQLHRVEGDGEWVWEIVDHGHATDGWP